MSKPVGYKSPPEKSRWKKGQSGNPTGRKKGTPNLRTDLIAELSEIILINEGGSAKRITKQRALLKSLAARGIQGDAKAANLILNLVLRMPNPEPDDTIDTPLPAEDRALLDAYIAKNLALKGSKP